MAQLLAVQATLSTQRRLTLAAETLFLNTEGARGLGGRMVVGGVVGG